MRTKSRRHGAHQGYRVANAAIPSAAQAVLRKCAWRLASAGLAWAVLANATAHAQIGSPGPAIDGEHADHGMVSVRAHTVRLTNAASGFPGKGVSSGAGNLPCGWDDPPPSARVVCLGSYDEGEAVEFSVVSGTPENPEPARRQLVTAYETVAITATDGLDYTGGSGTVTIEIGETSSRIVLFDVVPDSLDEDDEIFAIHHYVIRGGVSIGTDYAVATIVDDDLPPEVSIADASGTEVAGRLSFDVTLGAPSAKAITIDYATADGSATSPADYGATTGTLTFSPGQTAATVSVSVVDDGIDESDETFTVTLMNPVEVTVNDGSATGTIRDTGANPTMSVMSIGSVSGAEDTVGSLAFEVTLEPAGTFEATAAYATVDGTATAGSDYEAMEGTLTFAVGETVKTIPVPVRPDERPEDDETFTVTLSNLMSASPGSYGTGTIQDDDAMVLLADARGSEASQLLEFVVSVEGRGSARSTVLVDYETADHSAKAGTDYDAAKGTLTFPVGTSARTIPVKVINDEVHEGTESILLFLTSIRGAMYDDTLAVGFIDDDDEAPTEIKLTANPSRVLEGAGDTAVVVTAALDAARQQATTVTVSVSDSGAAGVVGFDPVPDFAITIAAGGTSGTGTFTLAPEDDLVDEADETLSVTGRSDLPVRGSEVILADDDEAPLEIALSPDPQRVREDAGKTPVAVTATIRGSARTEATTVTVSVSGSGAAEAVDFDPVPDFAITIEAGEISATGTFDLTPENDVVDEDDETLTLAGTSDLPVTGATVVLADDDPPSTGIELAAAPSLVHEDAGATGVAVTATLDAGARRVATTVDVSVSGGGAAEAVDFDPVPDFAITIAAGVTSGSATFTLTPEDDEEDETDETLTLAGTSDLPVTGTEVTLADDDEASTSLALAAQPVRVSEGAGETTVLVTATLDAATRSVATTVAVSVADSGVADAVDFDPVPDFAITIAAGETSGTASFALTPEDDPVDETDETLTLAGTSDLPVTGTEVTLTDDDEASTEVALEVAPSRVSEGAGATAVTVTARLDAAGRSVTTTVAVSVAGSGAADAVDFDPVPDFAITIEAGVTSGAATFTLTPEEDEVDETDETLTLSGTSDLPVTGTSVALADDDEASTRIVLSAVPASVSEGAGATAVTVTARLDASARSVATTLDVTVTGSGAAEAVDFEPVPDFAITIEAGETDAAGTFTLDPEADNTAEESETLTVAGTADLPVSDAAVTITDDDTASTGIALSAEPVLVSEGAGAVQVTVTAVLNGAARPGPTTVSVTVTGSGDPDAVDFEPVPGFAVTIAAGAAGGSGTFTLAPEDDKVVETDETLTVAGTADLPVAETSVTLADDDEASTRILLSAAPGRVAEDAGPTTVVVTATLDRGLRQAATIVDVAVAGSGDPRAVDFEPVPDFAITIAAGAGSASGAFTLEPDDDAVVEADETLAVSGTSELPVAGTSVTLADDDEASTRILLSATPGRVSEGAGPTPVVVTATLDRGLRQAATIVDVAVAGSGDPRAVDFEPVPDFALTIAAGAGSASGTFTLEPDDDAVVEADETLAVSGTSELPVAGTSVTVADDDEGSTRIVLSAVPGRVSEGAGPSSVVVTATLNRGLRQAATAVTVAVAGTGDPDAVDFDPVPGFGITIPANAASGTGTFELVPENDRQVETDEKLTLSGTSDLPVTAASVTLADDDEVSTRVLLFLALDPAQASEGGGPVRVTVTASMDRSVRPEATRIEVAVTGSGDPGAVDFAAVSDFEIVVPANGLSGTGEFRVTPEDDRIVERDETLTVSGTSSGLPVTPTSMTLLDDDEATVVLSAVPSRVSEGGGPVAVVVTATLTGSVLQEVATVTVSVAGSGDPDAVDFEPVSDFAINIAAGGTSGTGTFTLVPKDDAEDEVDEILAVTGESALSVVSTSLTLADDDESLRVVSVSDAAGDETVGELAFAVTLDAAAAVEVALGYATADGTALAGSDYEAASGTLTFAPGETAKTIRVVVLDDGLDEADEETFAVTLSEPSGAILGTDTATGVIRDDDEPPAVSVSDAAGDETVGELAFAVTLDGPSALQVSVGYATADGTATAGEDYEAASGMLTFAPGETAKTIRVVVLDDGLDEADEETFVVTLSEPSGAILGTDTATGVIRDDDEPPVVSVSDAAGDETVGELAFAVTLDAAAGVEVALGYATADGTALAGSDYEAASGTLTFAPGETAKTIRVVVLDDGLDEADEETFAVTLSEPSGAILGTDTATGVIRDDDEPPAVSVSDAAGYETVGELAFAVTLDGPSALQVSVGYATADGTATAGEDYEAASGTLTFAPGETAKTIRVVVLDDGLDEADEETFAVTLSEPSGAILGTDTATGVIRDDDEPPVVSVSDAAGDETVGELAFAVTLDAAAAVEVALGYATADGTALAGSDYEAASGTLTFAPGETAKTIRVVVLDDGLDEADEETFAVTLSEPSGAILGTDTATGVIRDDDEPPVVSVSDAAGDETVGELAFAVTLDGPSALQVSVGYATADGTALAGSDYAAASGMLTFAPGETAKTIRVVVLDDGLDETDEETFAVTLSEPSGAILGTDTATGVIRDDDEPPAVSVSDAAGDETVGELAFAVTLDAAAAVEVALGYATADGTALAGSDYEAASGTLTFAPGETAKTIRVVVLDDGLDEADEETFAVTLSEPSGAILGTDTATGVIRDDDEPPAVSVSDAAGDETVGELAFAVTLDGPSALQVSVGYATADGTATAGEDYEAASGMLTFAPGETAKTIRVVVLDDGLDEADEETFAVTLSEPSGAILGTDTATGVIRDDDQPPAVSVSDAAGDETVGELAFAVTLDAAAAVEVALGYATADGTALAGSDYEAASGTLTFAPGETAKTIRVVVLDDGLDEADEETFAVTLSEPSGAILGTDTATGVIRDDDEPPAVSVSDAAGDETVGELAFAVTLDGPSALQVSVGYATADGTATAGEDYEAASGTLTFAPGETAKTIRVVVLDDGLDEADEETFAVTLSEPSGAILGTDTATGVIRDDDQPPAVSVSDAAGDETVGELAFAVTLDGPSALQVSVGYATADGTATAGEDYEAASGTLTFAPGETAKTIRVVVLDDGLDEADEETFAVTLSEPSGAILGTDTATGVIRDDDEPPAVSVSDAAGDETVGELAFAVTLDAAAAVEVALGYATADGTALAGSDYEAASGTLTFAPGETAKTIRVVVLDDGLDEADEETFAVTLSEPSGAILGTDTATGVIRDDDEPPAVSVSDAAGYETVGELAFAVTLDGPSALQVSVGYATADGTATAGRTTKRRRGC